MAFPPGFLDELRARLSLASLVGRRVRLTRRGHEHVGLCPFHNEKTPSFYVVEDKGFFHCFGCGAHGDAVGFVMQAENLDFVEAVTRLAGEAGLAVPQTSPEERARAERQKTLLETLAAAARFYEARLWSPSGSRAREYLTERGLDEATIRRFRLGWASDDRQALGRALGGDFPPALLLEAGLVRRPEEGGEPYDYFRGRILFPIGDRAGRTIAFGGRVLGDGQPKYLNSPETPLFEKGRVLYGWSAARAALADGVATRSSEAIVTEGYMDVIALHRAGFTGAVAPLGTALTESQMAELWRLAPEPVISFDGDAAGERAALRALARALPLLRPGRSLRFAALPPGEDPDSLIRGGGAGAFAEILAAAQPLSELLWRSALAQRPIDTPERRADLERRLMDEVARIEDRSVQAEYRRFLRERLFARDREGRPPPGIARHPGGPRRFQRPGNPRNPHPPALREGPPPPPRAPGRVQREILLHMLLCHPFLVAEASEEVAQFDFPEPELDALRRAILAAEALQPGLDAEALRQHLADNGFAANVDALVSSSVDHAGFLGRAADPRSIRLGWAHVSRMVHEGDRSERASVAAALSRDISPATWDRFLAVRGREMEDVAADELSSSGLDDGGPGRSPGEAG